MSAAADTPVHWEAARFFDSFVADFTSFDGALIAQRYLAPYLSRRADGTSACFAAHEDIVRYFQSVLDGYRRDGCASCRWDGLVASAIGEQSLLAAVTWTLLRADGSALVAWRESYLLARAPGGLRVFASIDHAPEAAA